MPHITRQKQQSDLQISPADNRCTADLPKTGVLVVGAAASGVQIAEEIRRSGRDVTIAAGRHTRLPRIYRGRDILWWMDRIGVLAERAEQVPDLASARAQPSMQLVGRIDRASLDLGVLRGMGVRVVGHVAGCGNGKLRFHDDLAQTIGSAQRKLERLLSRIDRTADAMGAPAESWPENIAVHPSPPELDLRDGRIRTIVWATGFRRDYRWLHVPVLDAAGELIHSGGVTPAPGLYALGLRFQRRRNSNFLDGVGADAAELAAEIRGYLSATETVAA